MEKVMELIKLKQNEIKLNVPDIEIQTKKPMKKREIDNNSSIGNKSTMDSIAIKDLLSDIKPFLNINENEELVDLTNVINPEYKNIFADEKDVETQIFDLTKMKNEKKVQKKVVKEIKKNITEEVTEEDDVDFNFKKEKIDYKKFKEKKSENLKSVKPSLSKIERNDDKMLRTKK